MQTYQDSSHYTLIRVGATDPLTQANHLCGLHGRGI